jgi:transposase InsO family protein
MSTESDSNNAGTVWNIDLIKTRTQFELIVADADTGSILVRLGLQSITTASVVRALEEVIRRLGKPRGICTDGGTQFAGGTFKEFLRLSGIEHYYMTYSLLRRTPAERFANRS